MARNNPIRRYRNWYAKLLRFYPKPYRQRFGEGMEQTFNDLCRERRETGKGLFGIVLWMFVETIAGIVKEGITFVSIQDTAKRLSVWGFAIALLLLIPLVLTLLGSGVDGDGFHWTLVDFVVMGCLMLAVGIAYELVARRSKKTDYRVAFAVAIVTAFLLAWVNGAVGMIGSENQPANLLYGAVFAVGFIGSLMAKFNPRGMARTLVVAAIVQMAVPVIAMIIWPQISWGETGMLGVFGLNAYFATLFTVSALLFWRAPRERLASGAGREK